MKIVWEVLLGVYFVGFLLVLVANLMVGPVTLTLALLRAGLWPLWVFFGIPHGVTGGF